MPQFGGKPAKKTSSDSKRHFTVVMGGKEHGLYVSSTPSSAARKAVTKLCAANKSKKVQFHIREITHGSKKKTYGPYEGHIEKLKEPIELKGRVIKYKPVAKLSGKLGAKKGGMRGGEKKYKIDRSKYFKMEFIFPKEYDENFQEIFLKEIFVNKKKNTLIYFNDVKSSSSNYNKLKIQSIQFQFLDTLSDEFIIEFFKKDTYRILLSTKLASYEFKNYKIFIYVPSISINNSSESTQKYLWFENDGSIGIINDEHNFMIDFYSTP
jgi:hypothetical protein